MQNGPRSLSRYLTLASTTERAGEGQREGGRHGFHVGGVVLTLWCGAQVRDVCAMCLCVVAQSFQRDSKHFQPPVGTELRKSPGSCQISMIFPQYPAKLKTPQLPVLYVMSESPLLLVHWTAYFFSPVGL